MILVQLVVSLRTAIINVVLPVLGHTLVVAVLDILALADGSHDVAVVAPLTDSNLVLFSLFELESKSI